MTGNISEDLPASVLHNHPNVEVVVDETIYHALKNLSDAYFCI